jgi:hypothetical protein
MRSIFSLLKFRQKEIDLFQSEIQLKQKEIILHNSEIKSLKNEIDSLRKENKMLRDAVYPLTTSGIPIEKLAETLKPIVSMLESESEKKQHEASYRDSGTSLASNQGLVASKKENIVFSEPNDDALQIKGPFSEGSLPKDNP